jgi:3-phosphoshikimate 1-carboxyvinyltransferase
MTNRALVLAALAAGPTRITRPLWSRDTLLMSGALEQLGTRIDRGAAASSEAGGPAAPDPADWLVEPGSRAGTAEVDVGNAGTVMRFVPPAAALTKAQVTFRGDERASARPVGALLDGLRAMGAVIDDGGRRAIPFVVCGSGALAGGTAAIDASASSQLVSALLLAAPRFDRGAEIRHEGPRVPSAPHIEMTVQMLRAAGASVETGIRHRDGAGQPAADVWRVQPGIVAPGTVAIEPDLVNSAPFLAAALLTGGSVTIDGWPRHSLQPAGQILDVLGQMGASWSMTADGMRLTGSGQVHGTTADLRDVSELTPVLTALAALASSPSVFTGIGHQRRQETDRLAALAAEIGALGGQVTELPDGLEIRPRPLRSGPVPFGSHDDHRLVMAAAVLGLAVPGLRVANAQTVGKTFPGFFTAWARMLEPEP